MSFLFLVLCLALHNVVLIPESELFFVVENNQNFFADICSTKVKQLGSVKLLVNLDDLGLIFWYIEKTWPVLALCIQISVTSGVNQLHAGKHPYPMKSGVYILAHSQLTRFCIFIADRIKVKSSNYIRTIYR